MSDDLDPRLFAFRPDLAESGLEGQVKAARFFEGEPAHVISPVVDVRPRPDHQSSISTQLLYGENVQVFDRHEGWAWVKNQADSYVGYVSDAALATGASQSTHVVIGPRTFIYSGPDMKLPIGQAVSMGSRLSIVSETTTRSTRFLVLENGSAVVASHCRALDAQSNIDAVGVASLFLETPYLWGGRSGFGIDCSGLVQLALAMTGKSAPRDSDQQAAGLGQPIDPDIDGLQRGDLVFWKGHVALVEDNDLILHASGATMWVTREKREDAIARIRPHYGEPTGYRRP